MNRRELILASAVLLFSSPVLANTSPASIPLLRKRLTPETRRLVFFTQSLKGSNAPLQLHTQHKAHWIESISWTDETGANHTYPVNRNLPKDAALKLPVMASPSHVMIDITCLPLASHYTVVELQTV